MRLVLLLLTMLTGQIFAQEQMELKNRWMVGGNAEIYIERIGGNTGRLIAIAHPGAGYFVAKNFAIGARTPVSFFSNEYKLGIVPFTRYYLPSKSTARLFVELNGGRTWRGLKDVSTNRYSMEYSWLFGGSAGAAFFVNKNISIDIFLFYAGQSSRTRIVDTDIYTDALMKAEIGLGAGFQIFL